MPVKSLYLTNVGPFAEIEFNFDPNVNVFIGPNNSGKSSALWALGDVLVYPFSIPRKSLHQGEEATFRIHLSGTYDKPFEGFLPSWIDPEHWDEERRLESIAYMKALGFSKFIPA